MKTKIPFLKSVYFLLIVFIVIFALAVWMSYYFASFRLRNHQPLYNILTPQERANLIEMSSSPNGKDTLVGKQRQAIVTESSVATTSSTLSQSQEQDLIKAMSGH